MGQVSKPGAYELSSNMSFLDALALAGGPNDNAQPGKIVLARPSQNFQRVIDLGSSSRAAATPTTRYSRATSVCAQERTRVVRLRAATDQSAYAVGTVRSCALLMGAALPLRIQLRGVRLARGPACRHGARRADPQPRARYRARESDIWSRGYSFRRSCWHGSDSRLRPLEHGVYPGVLSWHRDFWNFRSVREVRRGVCGARRN